METFMYYPDVLSWLRSPKSTMISISIIKWRYKTLILMTYVNPQML